MRTVTWASIATTAPMGQQHYESEIQAAICRDADPAEWQFQTIRVTSIRSPIRDAHRVPQRLLRGPLPLARAVGRLAYRGAGFVHRLDLRLPPAATVEVLTIHDLPPLRFTDEGSLLKSALASAQRARCVIVPSEFAAQEIRELLGVRRVVCIPYGLSAWYSPPSPFSDEQVATLGIRGAFILHAAGVTARKNLAGLAAAWREVGPSHPDLDLVLCGPPDSRRDNLFEGLPNVVKPGRLEPSAVAGLMCRASVVVVPSLYEGFGLPALEGMACGVPVVAARRGALPEVCAGAALLVEPDGPALAAGIDQVLRDESLAADLRARGRKRAATFSWQKAAAAHLEVYAEALDP